MAVADHYCVRASRLATALDNPGNTQRGHMVVSLVSDNVAAERRSATGVLQFPVQRPPAARPPFGPFLASHHGNIADICHSLITLPVYVLCKVDPLPLMPYHSLQKRVTRVH